MSETAVVTVCGRPNVGKSTLTNALVGEKIAIVSNKPQTTRNRIMGIVTKGDTQFILLDTPGFIKPRNRLGDYMVNVVKESVTDVDCVLFLIEPVPEIGPGEAALLDRIRESGVPAVLVINKIDTVEKESLLPVIAAWTKVFDFDSVVPVSAKNGDGLDILLDQPERQICAELIREKILRSVEKEVPHGTAVEISRFSERDNGILDIEATIYCEKPSHKGILIGKNGSMLRQIGAEAREEIEAFLGAKVFLQTWVKVKENWRDSEIQLRNFGYRND